MWVAIEKVVEVGYHPVLHLLQHFVHLLSGFLHLQKFEWLRDVIYFYFVHNALQPHVVGLCLFLVFYQAMATRNQIKFQIGFDLEQQLDVVSQMIDVLPLGGQEEFQVRVLHYALVQSLKPHLLILVSFDESPVSFSEVQNLDFDFAMVFFIQHPQFIIKFIIKVPQ